MKRIEAPSWAHVLPPRLDEDSVKEAYNAVQSKMPEILRLVDDVVQRYVNDDAVTFTDDNFPSRAQLTSEYYIGDSWYSIGTWHSPGDNRPYYIVAPQACCLGKPDPGEDYLGLEVRVRVWKDTLEIEFYSVESAVI